MINDKSVLVMNKNTYQRYLKEIYKLASEKDDPIEYIVLVSGIKVIIDNDLPDNKIEIWDDEWSYYIYKEIWDFYNELFGEEPPF